MEHGTKNADPGIYSFNQIPLERADAVLVDHEHAAIIDALTPDYITVYSEDEFTQGRGKVNLIHKGAIATQIRSYGRDQAVIDARGVDESDFPSPNNPESEDPTRLEDLETS